MAAARPVLLELTPAPMRQAIEKRLRTLRAQRGRTLLGVGARPGEVFFVLEGECQIVLFSSNGREVSVRALSPGDIFGELSALDGQPRSASVVAVTDTRLIAMSRTDFLACVEASPSAAVWLARRLAAEVRRLTEKVFELSALNVQSRIHCELLRLARAHGERLRIDPAPTHAEIASRIGTHREAVTRELRLLAARNIIRQRRRALEIIDLGGLELVVGRALGDMARFGQDEAVSAA